MTDYKALWGNIMRVFMKNAGVIMLILMVIAAIFLVKLVFLG